MPYQVAAVLEVITHGQVALNSDTFAVNKYSAGVVAALNTTDFLLAYIWDPPGTVPNAVEVVKGKASAAGSTLNEAATIDTGAVTLSDDILIQTNDTYILKLDSSRALVFWRRMDPTGGFDFQQSEAIWAAVVTYQTGAPAVGTPTQVTFMSAPLTNFQLHTSIAPVLRPDGSVVMAYVEENEVPASNVFNIAARVVHLAISGNTITPTPGANAINTDVTVAQGSGGETQLQNLPNGEMLLRWHYPSPSGPTSPIRWSFLTQTGSAVAKVGSTTAYAAPDETLNPGSFSFAVISPNRLREMGTGPGQNPTVSVVRERAYDTSNHTVEDPPSFEENPAVTGWTTGFVRAPFQSSPIGGDVMWIGRSRLFATPTVPPVNRYFYPFNIVRQAKVPYVTTDSVQLTEPYVLPAPTGTNISSTTLGFGPMGVVAGNQILIAYNHTVTVAGAPNQSFVTVKVMVVTFTEPPLRWRQRPDCLTPGSATPCPCYYLPSGVVCIPPFWIWLTSSVQFGGRVGPLNTFY